MLRFFHINDNSLDTKADRLYKIRPIVDLLNKKFLLFYNVGKVITLDECMIKYNGRLIFKQFIMVKPVKFGVKGFLLCNSDNYYCYKFIIYIGKEDKETVNKAKKQKQYNSTERMIIKITDSIINKNKILYMDSY